MPSITLLGSASFPVSLLPGLGGRGQGDAPALTALLSYGATETKDSTGATWVLSVTADGTETDAQGCTRQLQTAALGLSNQQEK